LSPRARRGCGDGGQQSFAGKIARASTTRFESRLLHGQADCYILSFTQDATTQYYQSRSTGLIVPLSLDHVTTRDLTRVDYEELAEKT
jgi:hypothetical protein